MTQALIEHVGKTGRWKRDFHSLSVDMVKDREFTVIKVSNEGNYQVVTMPAHDRLADTWFVEPQFVNEVFDTLNPEDLKPGDWVEVIEDFKQWPTTFRNGQKLRVTDYATTRNLAGPSVDVTGLMMDPDVFPHIPDRTFASGQLNSLRCPSLTLDNGNLKYLRKCSPPEEKREEPSLFETSHTVSDSPSLSAASLQSMCELTKHLFCNEEGKPISDPVSTPIPPSSMSVSDFFRNSSLNPDERTLRRAGVKDTCGRLTHEGKDLLLAFLADKYKAELAKEARKFLKAKKAEDDEDAE